MHRIEEFNEQGLHANYAKLKCKECFEEAFVVEYPKQALSPTAKSKRFNPKTNDSLESNPLI